MPENNTAKRSRVSVAALALALAAGAAQARACDVAIAEQVTVRSIAADGMLDLADGRRARLATIQVPPANMPFAEEVRAKFAKRIEGKSVDIGYADHGTDRHGDLLAYVFDGGAWLQARLVADGFVRVASRTDTSRCAAALLKLEAEARAAKRGLWADPVYRVRDPNELTADIGTFQLVEGKVLAVKKTRDRTYLNFGPDYRSDFTVTISARDAKRLAKENIDPAAWSGKTIRIRGWLTLLNGPEIELTHKEQVELLD